MTSRKLSRGFVNRSAAKIGRCGDQMALGQRWLLQTLIPQAGSVILFAILKAWCGFILGGQDWLDTDFQRPVDSEIGIVPS